jgi:hypothetical protein
LDGLWIFPKKWAQLLLEAVQPPDGDGTYNNDDQTEQGKTGLHPNLRLSPGPDADFLFLGDPLPFGIRDQRTPPDAKPGHGFFINT